MLQKIPLILGSSSQSRIMLLNQINVAPDVIISPDIDESPKKKEMPNQLAFRLSMQKAISVSEKVNDGYIIGADTVACLGRRILEKSLTDDDVRKSLEMLSGRRHRVYTGISVVKKISGKIEAQRSKIACSIVKLKRFTKSEIEEYVETKHGINTASGYKLELGYIEKFIQFMSGSVSCIKGLPLLETHNILLSLGYYNKSNLTT